MSKLKQVLFKKNLNTVKLSKLTGIDRVVISFVANDKALFTPQDLVKVSQAVDTSPKQIWAKKELYITEPQFAPYKPKPNAVKPIHTFVSFRAVTDCYTRLVTKENLALCGYKSLQSLGMKWLKSFELEVGRAKKKQLKQQEAQNAK